MADNSEFLEVTSPATLKNLQAVNAELLKTIASVKDVNANMIGIKTPSGSDSAIKKLTADYDAQAVKIAKLQIELEKYTQAQNRTKISNNSLIISNNNVAKSNLSVEQSIERKNKASEREAAKAAILEGVYSKTQQKLNALTLEYRDLAVQKELGVKLTDNEIKRYEFLQARITKYDTTLKAVDATMGKYTRNVGNYASGFNPLGSSIGRIAQELPNLGQSFQIFAMSIGNNIAAFKDAISGIIAQNKALQAEGKATSSVMSQVASSLFSLNTLLYVGIAVFIAYGKEIGDWTKSLFAGEEALDNLTKSQTEFNNARVKGTKASLDERLALNQNLAVAKNDKIYMDERLIAVKKIVDQYPFYFKALTTNQILAGDTEKAEDALRKAIEKRAQADKLSEAVVKDKSRIIDLGFQINAQKRLLKAEQDSFDFENTTAAQNASHNKALINYKEKINDLEKERTGLIFENSSREQGIIKLRSESIGLDEKEEKAKKKTAKTQKERLDLTFSAIKSEYELQKAIIERQRTEASDRMNNADSTLEARLQARQEFSTKSIEILDLEIKEEKALLLEKYNDDLKKNNLAYKNKELTAKQWAENIQILNERVNNEQQTADSKNSIKFNDLLNQDLAYYKKIEEEKVKFSQSTAKMIVDLEIKKYKAIVDNANGENYTLAIRQKAFEQIVRLQRAELDLAKIRELANSKSEEETANIIQKYKDLNYEIDKNETPLQKAQKATDEWIKSNIGLEKSLNSIGLSSAKMFLDFDKNGQTTFDKLNEGAENAFEKFQIAFQGIGDIAQEVFNKITEASNQRFENELNNLQKQKDIAIAFAGDDDAAKQEIERQYEARQKKIKEREFKAKKQQAEFNILIDTAQAVVAALPNIPLSIAIAAIGAVQLALVASQQTPQYEHGTENHIGGAMIINDQKGSNYKELVTTPDGKSRIYEGRNVKVNAPKGTKVKTASETMDYLMFNDNLNSILTGNNISTPIIEVNNSGISDSQVNKIVSAIENKAEFSQLISNGDLKTVIRKGNTETEIMNRRINFLGKKV